MFVKLLIKILCSSSAEGYIILIFKTGVIFNEHKEKEHI